MRTAIDLSLVVIVSHTVVAKLNPKEDDRLRVFDKRNDVTVTWRELHNEELRILCSLRNIGRAIK
jgi:hypothetical protein